MRKTVLTEIPNGLNFFDEFLQQKHRISLALQHEKSLFEVIRNDYYIAVGKVWRAALGSIGQ